MGETDEGEEEGASLSFVPDEPDVGLGCGLLSQCDPWQQDCPDGEKCGPRYIELCGYATYSCISIVGDKAPGEPCTGTPAGDDCGEDSYCYPAMFGFFDEPSVCVPWCQGTPDDGYCDDAGLVCADDNIFWDGPLGCLPPCDPLGPETCAETEACTLGSLDQDDFACMIAPANVSPGQVCYVNQVCDGGLCVDGVEVEGCVDDKCCAALCDELAPDCPPGHSCVHVEVDDPESTVGVCSLD